MALAQVVYQLSTDADFAARMRSDPESALQERGWRLSKEEIQFLMASLTKKVLEKGENFVLARWI
jgi:hypothetical protein